MSSHHLDNMAPKNTQPRRGPWNQHEDEQLIKAASLCHVGKWVEISQIIGHRTPKQCRERWYQNLKPELDHSPIRPEEGEFIEHMVEQIGRKWAEIARLLQNRSDNAVKNWWNGGVNRRKRGEDRAASAAKDHALGPLNSRHRIGKSTPTKPLHHTYSQRSAHQLTHRRDSVPYALSPNANRLPPITVPPYNRSYEGNNPSPLSAAPSLVSDHPSHYSPSPDPSPAQYTSQQFQRPSITYSRPSSSGCGAEYRTTLPSLSPIARPYANEPKSLATHDSYVSPLRESFELPPLLPPINTHRSPTGLSRPATLSAERRGSASSTSTPTAASPQDQRMSLNNLLS